MTEGPQETAASGTPSGAEADVTRGDPELLGRLISGKYRIEKILGGGAMGAVYKARFAALEKNVAVKVMHRAIAVDPSFVGRFHREAKAASRLDHPNSMRVIDFGEEPDGLLYIAMEYVEGRDLYRVIHEDWPISNADLADMMMQALAAIAVAHEMGVIHRDLKPENLMIVRAKNDEERDAYHVKVCDFGIAKITEKDDEPAPQGGTAARKLTTQGLVVGTPEYMSPEQARGEKLDARSDLYSMGIILYQLLTGRTPFMGDTALSVVLKHITEVPVAPSVHYAGVHKGLEAVCLKAIAKDRESRWQTARAMRSAIREALDGRAAPDLGVSTQETVTDLAASAPPAMGTSPMVAPGASGPVLVARGGSAPGASAPGLPAAIESAPTVAGGMTASRMTPLGTARVMDPPTAPRKSRAGLVVAGLAVTAVLVGALVYAKRHPRGGEEVTTSDRVGPVTHGTNPPPNGMTEGTPTATPTSVNAASPSAPASHERSHRGEKNEKGEKSEKGERTATGHRPPPPLAVEAVSAAPAPEPPPPTPTPEAPAVTAATPPPVPSPPPTTPAAPPAPVFNPSTCRAALGAVRSTGATFAKDLQLSNTAGAWTSCAQSTLREKPAAPVSASVHINFTDKNFRNATCSGCAPALAACIASSTGRTVSLNIRGGDITGEPSFDVPVTFTCE